MLFCDVLPSIMRDCPRPYPCRNVLIAQAVLIFCRGLFTPGHNDGASKVNDNVHGASLRKQHGGYSLAEAYAEVISEHDNAHHERHLFHIDSFSIDDDDHNDDVIDDQMMLIMVTAMIMVVLMVIGGD